MKVYTGRPFAGHNHVGQRIGIFQTSLLSGTVCFREICARALSFYQYQVGQCGSEAEELDLTRVMTIDVTGGV